MVLDKLQVSRQRLEFIYSIAILIIIPILIAVNTILLTVSVRHNFDTELRQKADLANNVLGIAIANELDNSTILQNKVATLAKNEPDLYHISIVIPDNSASDFTILADNNSNLVGQHTKNLLYSLVISKSQSIAQLTKDSTTRYWSVVSPIKVNNNVIGLVATDVSLQQSDALISSTLLTSFGVLIVTIIIVVLLLINHFRFVEFAMLFRKMKEVDQMKNDFLSVATHELRAPMTIIKGTIENTLDGIYGTIDDKARDALIAMDSETDRLNNLVSDLLNVSRIEQGHINYELQTIDVRDTIDKIVNQYTQKAQSKNLLLSYEKPNEPAYITVDQDHMIEIMTNLIDNAIKYSVKGTILVSHKDTDKRVRISVRDTGLGMSAQDREKLFTRFYRIQTEHTKNIGGTGLGLWIIKQYIEHMGGSITVDSLEGVGTEFTVEFQKVEHQ